jgi:hypothetical protein
MSKDKAREFSLPDKVTVIKPEFANCKGCAQRVETYIASVQDWQKSYSELEAKLNYYKDHAEMMKEEWDKAEAKLAECVAALEFYGNEMNYTIDDYHGISGEMRCRVVLYSDSEERNDCYQYAGKRAREVLAKVKK